MSTFTYEFEELPLVIANGIPAGLINGCAELEFDRGGNWEIESVAIEGYQSLTKAERAAGKKPWIYVAAPAAIAWIIEERLTGAWRDRVQDAVNEQIEAERENAAEYRAEMHREARF